MAWADWKRIAWQWRGVWIATPSVALAVILLRWGGLLQAWEWSVYDQFLRLRPPTPRDERIAIVGIDEEDIRKIGKAVIPDAIYAKLISKLKVQKPSVIGLDVYRDQPVEPGHEDLVKIFKTTPNLVGIQKIVGDPARDTVAPPPALKELGQVGSNDTIVDADNKVRRGLLMVSGAIEKDLPSFAAQLAGRYLDQKKIPINLDEKTGYWRLKDTVFERFLKNDGSYVRADDGGYQIILNYRGGTRHFETVSLSDVLEGKPEVSGDWARDRIILIGAVGESSNDFFFTPYSSGLLSLPERMPGVEIHANIVSEILSSVLDQRPLINSWDEPWEWLWIFFWSAVGSSLTWSLRYSGGAKSFSIQRQGSLILAAIVLGGSCYAALIQGWWIPFVPPLLGLVGASAAITAYVARSAGDIRKTFGRYLNEEVVATLLENPEGLKMGGERRKITILTSDLRGFTAHSERLSPEGVVKILNFYLGYMADTITEYKGTIDEFMGDGILVLFGAPTSRPDDARRSIACAVAMQQAIDIVNVKMKEWDLPHLEMGIGIHTGEVVVGNIGSEKRTKYGIVGAQVNLTYRIESYTTGGQIFVSEATLKEAGDDILINGHKEVSPKGVKEPITIYDIGGIGGEYNLFLTKEEEIFVSLKEPIQMRYALLEGKDIGETRFQGTIIKLSDRCAEVELTANGEVFKPNPLTNVKLNFLKLNPLGDISEDVYAKVLEKEAQPNQFYMQFTAKPMNIEKLLHEIYQANGGS